MHKDNKHPFVISPKGAKNIFITSFQMGII